MAAQVKAAPEKVPDFICFDGLVNDAYLPVIEHGGTKNINGFAGECKYPAKPADAPVYFRLKEKVSKGIKCR